MTPFFIFAAAKTSNLRRVSLAKLGKEGKNVIK
jgi:hypothetical protein